VTSFLYLSFVNQYSLCRDFPFPIVLVSRYKLSLCHTPIKPDLLDFLGIDVFACRLRDHEVRINWYGAGHISPLFHTNWALLGPELDELESFLHAP
jgi:hypothetical protein